MSKESKKNKRIDGIVDAAHFGAQGELLWVRAYERRGPTWSDLVLLDRLTLIQRLDAGKRFYVGKRQDYQASEFDLGERIQLQGKKRNRVLVMGKGRSDQDRLQALPTV